MLAAAAAAFAIVCVASNYTANAARDTCGVPLVTAYLFVGMLAGPQILHLLSKPAIAQLTTLVDDDAMGFIGFTAGSKFLLSELKGTLKPVLILLVALVVGTYAIVLVGVLAASPWLELTRPGGPAPPLQTALVTACLSVARSPSSAIAIISELDARGPYTSATLSVTVLMDVVVVLLFSMTVLLVQRMEPSGGGQQNVWATLVLFGTQLAASLAAGGLFGFCLHRIIAWTAASAEALERRGAAAAAEPRRARWARIAGMVLLRPLAGERGGEEKSGVGDGLSGDGLAERLGVPALGAAWLASRAASRGALLLAESAVLQLGGSGSFAAEEWEQGTLGASLHQPLLVCLMAGFVVANFTTSRLLFLRVLDISSPYIYVAFFTLTGANLRVDTLVANLPAAALIVLLRLAGIVVGTRAGGAVARYEPQHTRQLWKGFVTQAGVTLGLLSKVATTFPWGPSFAAVVLAVVVINQLLGPLLYKEAILSLGEAHPRYTPTEPHAMGSVSARPRPRSAVVISDEGDADVLGLIQRLRQRGWDVVHLAGLAFELESETAAVSSPRMERSAHTRSRRFANLLRRAGEGAGSKSAAKAGRGRSGTVAATSGTAASPILSPEGLVGEAELRLLWAVASLDRLDTIALMMRDDTDNLRVCKLLTQSVTLLPALLEWQTVPIQLLTRLGLPSFERDFRAMPALRAFRLTFVTLGAAFANLCAEMLHPEAHWSLAIDNTLPLEVSPARTETRGGTVGRAFSAEGLRGASLSGPRGLPNRLASHASELPARAPSEPQLMPGTLNTWSLEG